MLKITKEIYVMMNFIGVISAKKKKRQSHGELFLNFAKVDSFSLVS